MVQGNNGIYRLSVPQGKWELLTGLEGVNDPQSFDSFMSLTPDRAASDYEPHWRRPDLFPSLDPVTSLLTAETA